MNTDDTAYQGPEIPTPLGEQLRVVLDLDDRPRTFGDYVDAMAVLVDRDGIEVDLETLCTTDESPHRATYAGQTQHYHCTLDAVIVPFVADDIDRVEVETVSPVSGDAIAYTITKSDIVADPPGAILSFGVAADVESTPTGGTTPTLAYRRICPYGKAFVSRTEYEQWADVVDAHTMVISMKDSLELAEALGQIA